MPILSVIGWLRITESNVPEADAEVSNANCLIEVILCLYAALAVAMLIVLLLLLLRRLLSRAAKHNKRHKRFDPRPDASNPKMKRDGRASDDSKRWNEPVSDRGTAELSKDQSRSVSTENSARNFALR